MGMPNSAAAAFGSSNNPNNAVFTVKKNGGPDNLSNYPYTVTYAAPANTTISADGTYFTVTANQTVTIPVTFSFSVGNPGSNTYGAQLIGVQWFKSPGPSGVQVSVQSGWTTPSISSTGATPSYASSVDQASLTASIWDAIRAYMANPPTF